MNEHSVAYDLVLLAHVLAAAAGVVAGVAAAGFALALRRALRRGGPVPEAVVRYYRPGANWVGRVLFAVPVLGAALVAMSGGRWRWSDAWVSIGMGVWLVVAGLAEAVLWPCERRLQAVVADRLAAASDGDRGPVAEALDHCLQAGWTGLGLGLALVATGFLMVAKP